MRLRMRKLVGATLLLVFIPAYAVVVMTVAVARLPETSVLTHTLFFLVAGLLWVVPAGLIIRWMQRPEPGG
jgi:hypothetical protein